MLPVQALEAYVHQLEALPLPTKAEDLEAAQAAALTRALLNFDTGKFGISSSEEVLLLPMKFASAFARQLTTPAWRKMQLI